MSRPGKKTTIKDLAEAAGTSATTASLVMNGSWQQHRINPDTAEKIKALAQQLGYQPNQRARALRLSRSSLSGLIIPHHRNRFFAGLAEHFEHESHHRGLVPIIGSTQRVPEIEDTVGASIIAQEVEFLVIAGVNDPSKINAMAHKAGVRCVNLDLPGKDTFSVVTDNFGGAQQLTRHLLAGLPSELPLMFLGGRDQEYATDLRVKGFHAALAEDNRDPKDSIVLRCGYNPQSARDALHSIITTGGHLPAALLVNSITAFEGFVTLWRDHPELFKSIRVACFDWDPFASCLPIETIMLRQDVEGLIHGCFDWFDTDQDRAGELIMVPPRLVFNTINAKNG